MSIKIGIGKLRIGTGGGGESWEDKFISDYSTRINSEGGSIINAAKLKTELAYIKSAGVEDKVGYWINKDFGFKAGTETNPECFVCLSFDDAMSPATENTVQYFADKGLTGGTFYVNAKYVGNAGYASWATLAAVKAAGHDIQCHSWSHAKSDVYANSDFTTITDEEIISELENSNAAFVANGLPSPQHFAYPRYVTDNDAIKLVSGYRKSQRGYIPSENNYMSPFFYYSTVWHLISATSIDWTNEASKNSAKSSLSIAKKLKHPIHFSGHSVNETYFKDFLDYCIAENIDIVTISEYYNRVNTFRDKYYSVFMEDYEILKYMDGGTKLGEENGLIVFNDTLANVGSTVADWFVSQGYKVAFWDDITDEAFAYAIPNNVKYYDAVNLTNIDPALDRLYLTNHKLETNTRVYLTGDEAPGGLSFNTIYFVRDRRYTGYWDFKLTTTYNGAVAIDITSAGTNVKINTLGFRDVLKLTYINLNSFKSLITSKYSTGIKANIYLITYLFGGNIKDCGLEYFYNLGLAAYPNGSNVEITYNQLQGTIPLPIVNSSDIGQITLNYCRNITGGLSNLVKMRTLNLISLSFNSINESIPDKIGDLIYLTNFYVDYNQLTGIIPVELGNCILMTRIRLNNNQLSGYEAGAISVGMTVLVEVDLSVNAITNAADINQILADVLALQLISGKIITLRLIGGTNAAPTGQGITDKADLIARGCTVTTN